MSVNQIRDSLLFRNFILEFIIILSTRWPELVLMVRLNSGNFGIFYPDGFYLNLNSSLESALKIIKNDIDIAYEL